MLSSLLQPSAMAIAAMARKRVLIGERDGGRRMRTPSPLPSRSPMRTRLLAVAAIAIALGCSSDGASPPSSRWGSSSREPEDIDADHRSSQ